MILNTHPNDRKEMVRSISELTATEATYLYMPTCAYQIGTITVNRNGSVTCDDEAMVETILPMLRERGWLDAEQETEKAPEDSEAPASVREMKLTMPIEGWTVSQMTNLLRLVYSKQRLINRMLNSEMLYVGEAIITTISENPPGTPEDFEAKVQTAIETGQLKGLDISAEKVSLSVPLLWFSSARKRGSTGWHQRSRRSGVIPRAAVSRSSLALTMFTRFRRVFGVCAPMPTWMWIPQDSSAFAPAVRRARTTSCTIGMSSQRHTGLTTSAEGSVTEASLSTVHSRPSGMGTFQSSRCAPT